jgi:hypothetical protein
MLEKVIVFTNKRDFFERKGFLIFDKPVFKFVYQLPFLKINGKKIKTDRPLRFLEKLIKSHNLYAIGFISYDYKVFTLGVKSLKSYEFPIPHIYFLLFKTFKSSKSLEFYNFTNKIKEIEYPEKKHFTKMVNKALEYIKQGDIYQINLSDRLKVRGIFNKEKIFYNLTQIQPTEFMFFFKDRYFSVLSASMELFFWIFNLFYFICEIIKF